MLADLLEKYEGPLTADFRRVYGLRLQDSVTELEEQELADLIQWLPPGCAFQAMQEANGDLATALRLFLWTSESEMSLWTLNFLQKLVYITEQVHTKAKVSPPEFVPGPRSKPVRKKNDANAIARQFLAAQGG